jgi:bile acid-coenzyme A ligase
VAEAKPFVQLLAERAAADPDRTAITCGTETTSRGNLERSANRLARAYEQFGVGEADFVTIALPNSIEFYAATVATWKLGAVPQPVSPQLPLAERQAIVALANPTLIVGPDPQDHPGRPCVPTGFVPDPTLDDGPHTYRVAQAWKAPTSGGSTGRPKLIVATEPAQSTHARLEQSYGMRPDDCQLVPGPLYHNAPFTCSTAGLLQGQHLVVLPRFDAVEALRAIAAHRVSWVNLVPTMMLRMHREIERQPDAFDLSSLRVVWHMAAPCPAWLKQAWIDLVGSEKVMELYGGTEAQAFTVISGSEWLEHRGSVGKPVVGEMTILDPDGNELPAGDVGEVFMRPRPGRAPTYRYIGANAHSRDGWESLGDLGWMDSDGYLYLSDRRTDLILSGGANVYPAEVEAAIDAHPNVLSSVVIGLPDADLGERVHALVQVSGNVSERDLRDHLDALLVRYKIPRSIEFIDEPLRDDAGKVRRGAVREMVIARRDSGDALDAAHE